MVRVFTCFRVLLKKMLNLLTSKLSPMKDIFVLLMRGVLILLVAWYVIAAITWQVRNPKANQMTIITHFGEAMTFTKNPNFQ